MVMHQDSVEEEPCTFYCLEVHYAPPLRLTLDSRYSFALWKPTLRSMVPHGIRLMPFAAWWLMHYAHLFQNRDYGLFVVYHGEHLIHRSGVFPGYFRFPFMAKDALQIGDTWTHANYRGQGIASFAVQQILALTGKPGRKFWYLSEASNRASISVIEKVGFVKVGYGVRTQRFGLRLFGAFEMHVAS